MRQTRKRICWDCSEEVEVQIDAPRVIGDVLGNLCELQIAAAHRLASALALRAVAVLGAAGGGVVEAEGH